MLTCSVGLVLGVWATGWVCGFGVWCLVFAFSCVPLGREKKRKAKKKRMLVGLGGGTWPGTCLTFGAG